MTNNYESTDLFKFTWPYHTADLPTRPLEKAKNSYYDNIIDIVTVTESSNDEITFFVFLYNPVYGTSSLHNGGKVAAAWTTLTASSPAGSV